METGEDFTRLLDGNNNNWDFDYQAINGFQTTMCSSLHLGGEVEEAVRRGVHTVIPALVEESVKREMQALMPPLVEEAVVKGIQAAIPALVEEVMHKGMQTLMPIMVEEMRKMISTSLPLLQTSDQQPNSRQLLHMEDSNVPRTLQLHFERQSQPFKKIFTQKSLHDHGISLRLVLRDDFGNIVEAGAESSMKIKIVVLDGDFSGEVRDGVTGNRFHENVLKRREHKPPLLAGKHEMALSEGVADVGDIMFTDNSSWMRSKKFRLGAKVARSVSNGVVIKEAISEAFEVKERRGESYQKKGNPALNDEVWRLHHIARDGKIHSRLEKAEINSVNDLLQRHHEDEESLKKILQVADKKFQNIIKQAKSAYSDSNQPGYNISAIEGKDAMPLAYEFPNELSRICGLNYHPSLLIDGNLLATESSATILHDTAAAKPGDSEMQHRMEFQPEDPIHMFLNSSPGNLEFIANNMDRVQAIENELRTCVGTRPTKQSLNKTRWRSVGVALRFSVFSIAINRQARRAQKKQRSN